MTRGAAENSGWVSPELTEAAKRLRREMTPAERRLWRALRNHRLAGMHFRRQHAIERYVLDFYCADARLAVEVDGPVHDARSADDENRTDVLFARGIRVLRVTNEEVSTALPSVLARIRAAIATSSASAPPVGAPHRFP